MHDVARVKLALEAQSAVNPRAVANTLVAWLVEDSQTSAAMDPATVPLHTRLLLGQLNWLLGMTLGPSSEDLDAAHTLIMEAPVNA